MLCGNPACIIFQIRQWKTRPKLEFGRALSGIKHDALFKGTARKRYYRICALQRRFRSRRLGCRLGRPRRPRKASHFAVRAAGEWRARVNIVENAKSVMFKPAFYLAREKIIIFLFF
jgi:hypothetical protein